MGTIIKQEHGVIAYYSFKLKGSETNYSITEKEMLAVIRTIQKFYPILYGNKLNIYTDNKNNIFKGDMLTNRAQRWLLYLHNFDSQIIHIPGKYNTAADFLSRASILLQIRDFETISESDNLKFVQNMHNFLGHPGFNNFYQTIRKILPIKNIRRLCAYICSNCDICNKIKYEYNQNHVKSTTHFSEKRGELVSTDICGPFTIQPPNKDPQRIYLLRTTDLHSRYCTIGFLKNITAPETAEVLRKILLKHEIPRKILSDNGIQFKSNYFKLLMNRYNIKHILSRIYNPRANSKS